MSTPQTAAAGGKPVITHKNGFFLFYDIESLSNVFSICVYDPRHATVFVMYLIDDQAAVGHVREPANGFGAACSRVIREANPRLPQDARILYYDLGTPEGVEFWATVFGVSDARSVNDPGSGSSYPDRFRPVCDTDPGYDPIGRHYYLAGYNSLQYDTTMMAVFAADAMLPYHEATTASGQVVRRPWTTASAARLRQDNDNLFSEQFKSYMPRYLVEGPRAMGQRYASQVNRIRQAMISSGRYIDVSLFNEKQSRVSQKRLSGMLGHQILESDKLSGQRIRIENPQELMELLAYNVSDVVNLSALFASPSYGPNFDTRAALMSEYPETVYQQRPGTQQPWVSPERVRRDRLNPDSSSAKFVAKVLAPYAELDDIEFVDFRYPHPKIAQAKGIERVDVLDFARDFFFARVHDEHARSRIQEVYDYYDQIRGKNFNQSEGYMDTWGHPAHELNQIPKGRLNVPYFYEDGSTSTCFVTFSTGGIHGAELDVAAFEADLAEHRRLLAVHDEARRVYPDPADFRRALDKELKMVPMPSGALAKLSDHMSNQTIKNAAWKERSVLEAKAPVLFNDKPDGSNSVNTKYVFTSVGRSNHEDFTSYYPNMLRNMMAFDNPDLGVDRYARLLEQKSELGALMDNPSLTPEERLVLKVKREGTKLMLNAASGAGDANHRTNIRMNNTIISMRIIGQLFSWVIGQAQTFAGARVVSTNTDGLYTILEEGLNNEILARESARINVEIEPEPLLLVSKDSNNRLELGPAKKTRVLEVKGASGSSLACQARPSPNYSLAHPAAIDNVVTRYLTSAALTESDLSEDWFVAPEDPVGTRLDAPFDQDLGMRYLRELVAAPEGSVHALLMFQNVIAASNGNISFPFAADPVDPEAEDVAGQVSNPRVLQHQNRVLIVKRGTPGAVSLHSARAKKIAAPVAARRKANDELPQRDDPVAEQILLANGAARHGGTGLSKIPSDCDIVLERISGIDPTWSMLVVNQDLHCMSEDQRRWLLSRLDLEKYLGLAESNFEKNWRNRSPQPELTTSSR